MAKATQVSLSQPSLAAVFHDKYKDQPNGEATLEQKIAIQEGREKLPSGSRVRLDCNPQFNPPITRREDGDLIPYPGWRWKLFKFDAPDVVVNEGVIGAEDYAIDGFVGIQGPETETSLFNKSLGYAPIFALDAFPFKGRLEISVEVPGMASPALVIPWVEHA